MIWHWGGKLRWQTLSMICVHKLTEIDIWGLGYFSSHMLSYLWRQIPNSVKLDIAFNSMYEILTWACSWQLVKKTEKCNSVDVDTIQHYNNVMVALIVSCPMFVLHNSRLSNYREKTVDYLLLLLLVWL